jgi:hypothetical protein
MNFHHENKTCNLPLIRALNAELVSLASVKDEGPGLTYRIDGNTFTIPRSTGRANKLLRMDSRMARFEQEEKQNCQKEN